MANDSGTIDITALVETMKDTWTRWAVALVLQAASSTPYTAWLKLPVISTLFSLVVELIVKEVADAVEMEAFFLNTAIRKASQAQDYIDANSALTNLAPSASDEDYEKAEQTEMAAFRNFVLLTN